MANRTKRTPEKKRVFLEALGNTANVTRACKVARFGRTAVYGWRAADQEFARAWDAALALGTDALEDEAVRRAHEGTLKPVYQGGKKVGVIREYSDTLLIFLLKGRRPEKYKDRAIVEHDVTDRLAERLEAAAKRLNGNIPSGS